MNKPIGRVVLTFLALGLLQSPQLAVAQSEGLKVHGHWTIEIRQPDGVLVTHREFENALAEEGAANLVSFLARGKVPGLWRIELRKTGFAGDSPCEDSLSHDTACFIAELSDTFAANRPSHFFRTLTISAPVSGVNGGKLVLGGVATAARDSQIAVVATHLGSCDLTAPQPCTNPGPSFTLTTIKDPITGSLAPIRVLPGQIIQVTVVLSFS